MKILIVGSGGREHAIAWRLAQTPEVKLYAIPGNPGMAKIAECLPSPNLSPNAILAAARSLGVNLTIVGPEGPLVAGVVDLFRAAELLIVGPTAESAQLEGSKIYAKRFFEEHRIPTARFQNATNSTEAFEALTQFSYPIVIKADGLAAGKGVVIAQSRSEAEQACLNLGPALVIEEFLEGTEISFIVLSDGSSLVPLIPSRDHKRALNGDVGPNTGGMGAYCDASLLTEPETNEILDTIIRPTVDATSFTGFLYAGLMMTRNGPKLLEYNVRLGDPETQAIMHHLDNDLGEILLSAAQGRLSTSAFRWRAGVSHCVVATAEGYPSTSRTGDAITGIEQAEQCGATVFHAGTRVGWSGYATAGGRVLTVTSSAPDLSQAARKTYECLKHIHFQGIHYRTDIGRAREPVL